MKPQTVEMSFVVASETEAEALIHEIAEEIGNGYGVPFYSSKIRDATKKEEKFFQENEE